MADANSVSENLKNEAVLRKIGTERTLVITFRKRQLKNFGRQQFLDNLLFTENWMDIKGRNIA